MESIYNSNYRKVEHATRALLISHQQLEIICQLLEDEFKRGLHRETNPIANVKMYPTHIRDRPAKYQVMGHFAEPEEGKFLALDLGGTNFRVILVELEGSQFHMDNETYSLSTGLMHGPGQQLFDYIADCLHKFVTQRRLAGRLPLGFTFSFPIEQEGLAHARLVNWTKGFKCSGVEGRDVVELLKEAIERRPDLDIEVMAVVNDTTGTLISCAHQNRECRVGLIVGTGTNACYMERVDNVHRMNPNDAHQEHSDDEDEHAPGAESHGPAAAAAAVAAAAAAAAAAGADTGPMAPQYADIWRRQHSRQQTTVVNTEWGAFGDNGILDFVRTNWDNEIDINSVNCGKQKFEKMISGLYIGELCRRIMVDMALDERVLFGPICYDSANCNKTINNIGSNNNNINSSSNNNNNNNNSDGNNPAGDQQQRQQQQQRLQRDPAKHNMSLCFADVEKVRQRERLLIEGKFTKPFAFGTKYVSDVESDPVDVFDNTRLALKEAFDIDWASDQDCAIVKLICSRVSTRAAHLVSAAVACLLNKMARPHTVVGVDGSMFKYHPHFHSIMAKKTKELTHPEYKFQLMFSEDGSGRGAAIVASVACKQRRISKEISRERQMKASLVQPS